MTLHIYCLSHAHITGTIHATKIPTGPTGKSGRPQKVDQFFETFPVGPNGSTEFWTKISRNFGWMDRALKFREWVDLFLCGGGGGEEAFLQKSFFRVYCGTLM